MKVIKNKQYVIGSDNAGYPLKEIIKELLESEGLEYEDVGVDSDQDKTIYPEIAERVVNRIKKK